MKKLRLLSLLAAIAVATFFASCGNDSDSGDDDIIEVNPDGFYVHGTNTIAAKPSDAASKMALAQLDSTIGLQLKKKDNYFGKYMWIGANSTIQFTLSENQVSKHWGAPDGGKTALSSDIGGNDMNCEMIYDTLVVDGGPINIATEGLYYVVADMNSFHFRIMKVEAQIIGDATPGQWATSTAIPTVFTSKDSTIWEINDLALVEKSGYKYQMNKGWHAYSNADIATQNFLGVKSYQVAWDTKINDVGMYNENIPNHENGSFTVRVKYDAVADTWKETKIKTGKILIDYSDVSMGLFGNAYRLPSGDTANWGSGTDGYGLSTPSVSGKIYTWNWDNVTLIEGREFIFLENGTWGGLQLDWSSFTAVDGQAVTDGKIVDATTTGGQWHNFQVKTGGNYNVSLVIDAQAETRTATITSAE